MPLIIVGLARCIAMVIIWNDLARGDREAAAVLVALNSVFQVIAFAGLGWFYPDVLPGWLPVPELGERSKGRAWYETWFLPRVGPFALYGLLFTVVILLALQGDTILARPVDVARIALPAASPSASSSALLSNAPPRSLGTTYVG